MVVKIIRMYVFTQQDLAQGQFLSRVQLICIQCFSTRLVVLKRLEYPVYPNIYSPRGVGDGFVPF